MNMRTILADPPRPETNVLVTHDPLDSTRSVRSIPWPLFTPREANMGLRHVNWCNRPLRSTRLVRRCLGARYNATGRFKSPNHSDFYHQRIWRDENEVVDIRFVPIRFDVGLH